MSNQPSPQAIRERVWKLIEPACRHHGYDLVDVRFLLDQGGWVLRVFIDVDVASVPADTVAGTDGFAPDLVDLDDCERMSRELSAVLDVEDPIVQAYSLEVSSPGIDRPLVTVAHFQRFVGAEIKLTLDRGLPMPPRPDGTPSAERKNFRGVIEGVDDAEAPTATVRLRVDGQVWQVPIADVDVARIIPDWDAVMKGDRGQVRMAPSASASAPSSTRPTAPRGGGKPAEPRSGGRPDRSGRANAGKPSRN